MPILKDLICHVQWAETSCPFPEYGTIYGDGLVETYIAVPNHPQVFTIRLSSRKFIAEGLSMVVFIDGRYQCNRNRVNLEPEKKDVPQNKSRIDLLVRQNEKALGDGTYMGREWRFDETNIVSQPLEGADQSHFHYLGTIEVLVLRCQSQHTYEKAMSTSSSGEHSEIMDTTKGGFKTGLPDADNGKINDSASASAPAAPAEEEGGFLGMVGLFDGPADEPPSRRASSDGPYDGHYTYWQIPGDYRARHGPQEGPSHAARYPGPPAHYEDAHRERYPYRETPPRALYAQPASPPPRSERRVHFDYGDGRGPPHYTSERYNQPGHFLRERDERAEYIRSRPSYHDSEPGMDHGYYADYPLRRDRGEPRYAERRVYPASSDSRPRSPPPSHAPQPSYVPPSVALHLPHGPAPGLGPHIQPSYAVPPFPMPPLGIPNSTAPVPPGPPDVPPKIPIQPPYLPQAQAPPGQYVVPMGFYPPFAGPIYPYPPAGNQSLFHSQGPNANNGQNNQNANGQQNNNGQQQGGGNSGNSENNNNKSWGDTNNDARASTGTNNNNSGGNASAVDAAWVAGGDTGGASNKQNDTDWTNGGNGNTSNNTNQNDGWDNQNETSGNTGDSWTDNNAANDNKNTDDWNNGDNTGNTSDWNNNDNAGNTGQNWTDNNGADTSNNAANGSGGNRQDGGDWSGNAQNKDGWSGGNDQQNSWNTPQNNNAAPNSQQNTWNAPPSNNGGGNYQPAAPQNQMTSRVLYGPYGPYYGSKALAQKGPPPDAEEEPRYDVPAYIAKARNVTKQVQPGPGYIYVKKRCAPQYIDTFEEPYAKFVFKYRTKEQLKNEIGVDVGGEPTGDQELNELEGMDKAELIQLLLRAKGALGGNIPGPPPKVTPTQSFDFQQVPVLAPDVGYLNYTLPTVRPPKPMPGLGIRYSPNGNNNGGNGGGSNWQNGNTQQNNSWETNNANANDNWAQGATNNNGWDGQQERKPSTQSQAHRPSGPGINEQYDQLFSGKIPTGMAGPAPPAPIQPTLSFGAEGTTGGGQTTWQDSGIVGAGPRPPTPTKPPKAPTPEPNNTWESGRSGGGDNGGAAALSGGSSGDASAGASRTPRAGW